MFKSRKFGFEYRRDLTTNCGPDDATPATRANTTENLAALRSAMAERGVDAYVVPLGRSSLEDTGG